MRLADLRQKMKGVQGNEPYYDYVVIGGGGAGCPFARTMADAGFRVLVIERGKSRLHHSLTQDIYGSGLVMADEKVNQLVITPTGVRTHVAAVLGGGTATGMGIMVEEDPEYLTLIENHANIAIDQHLFRQASEWVASRLAQPMKEIEPYSSAIRESLRLSGTTNVFGPRLRIAENATWNAFSLFDSEDHSFRRSSDVLLGDIKHPQPATLDIVTSTLAERIQIDNGKATCVLVRETLPDDIKPMGSIIADTTAFFSRLHQRIRHLRKRKGTSFLKSKLPLYQVCAKEEIIVAAGTLLSPVILAKSGIGNSEQMKLLDIDQPYLINEAIGNNLIDRGLLPLTYFRKDYADVDAELEPQVCGRVGLAVKDSPLLPQLASSEFLANKPKLGERTLRYSQVVFEEMSGGRILEGFLYATRVFARPAARSSMLLDWLIMMLNHCSEKRRSICATLMPASRCLRQLAATWFFVSEPKSRGFVRFQQGYGGERADFIIDPKYYTDQQDIFDGIRGLQHLLTVAHAEPMTKVVQDINSSESCSRTIRDTLKSYIKDIYFPVLVGGNSNNEESIAAASAEGWPITNEGLFRKILLDQAPFSPAFLQPPSSDIHNQTITTFPAQLPDTDDIPGLLNYVRDMMQSMWHLAGTVALGTVLDGRFRIKGIDRLAVIDASALPMMSRFNPTQTVISMGRYAALQRLEEHGKLPFDPRTALRVFRSETVHNFFNT